MVLIAAERLLGCFGRGARGLTNRHSFAYRKMLKLPIRLLLSSGLFLGQAARLDSHHEQQADVGSKPIQQKEAVQLQRYRALDESEFQRWLAGENVSLLAKSFHEDETDDITLPREWSSKLEKIKKLGEGSFGKVYQCKVLCETYKEVYVSVKLIVKKSSMVRKEIQILEDMRGVSDYCISAVGEPPFIDNSAGYWIMMPYMNGGELHDFLHKCNNDISGCNSARVHEGRRDWTKLDAAWTTPYILGLFDNMVEGVQALHDKAGLLHLDLKPANVMLNCQGSQCYAAVIDLGLACDPKKRGECGGSGTPLYMPREVYMNDPEGACAIKDPKLPAIGATCVSLRGLGGRFQGPAKVSQAARYELLYVRAPPFFYAGHGSLSKQIVAYDAEADTHIPRTQTVDNLVRSMLQKDWKKRPSLSEIRKEIYAATHASAEIPTCLGTTATTTVFWRQNLRHERAAEQLEKAQREREEALAAAQEAKRQRDEAKLQHEQYVATHEKWLEKLKEDKRYHEQWLAVIKEAERQRDEAVAATKEAKLQHEQEVAATKQAQSQHEQWVATTKQDKLVHEQWLAAIKEAQRKRDEAVAATKEAQSQHEQWVATTKQDKLVHEQWLAAIKEAQRKRDEAVAATKEAQRQHEEAVAAANEELAKQKHGRKHHDDVEEEHVHRRRRRPDAEPAKDVDKEHRPHRPVPPAPTTTTTTTTRKHHDAVDDDNAHRRRRRPEAEPTHAVDKEPVHRRRRPSAEPTPTDAVNDEHAHRRRRRPEDS
ncbi:Interferon-induced, double-stranded RNA-activated protein kinase [Symbiodinium microadriaticum]|uniref:Interferon-induced, double-stranded RNA-activated protein kinase n=1 Tax=Symbiodinium microadriaticum TaxID=2951 RepID=A0A1Q9DTA4_SYMMI|nr:Interferon-induced, double-stranded RNA-activated protein kinase [Symbiodinium microadriaticum]